MSLNSGWSDPPGFKRRFLLLSLAAIAIFALLALRLWYLQVISYHTYKELSERNRVRYVPIAAPRGPIYDRDGVLLLDNRPSFEVSVLRQEVEDKSQLLARLSPYLGVDKDELARRWQRERDLPRYLPIPLAEDVSRDVFERVQENAIDLPGVITQVRPMRDYPYGDLAAHLLGYLGEVTEQDLQSGDYEGTRPGDYVGQSGLEKNLDNDLRGVPGEKLIEVDVKGKELRTLRTREPIPGDKVYLTLKASLQEAADKAFGDQAGAAVVLDVHTGEVLAMVSKPSFSPAVFARGISGKEWIKLLQNPRHPLQNKAITGQYPPGSTFKIVTALAALKAGTITPSTTVDCTGSLEVGNREFRCWKKEGHGVTDLVKAIRESCDVYFYKAALDVGIDRIAAMAHALGLGQTLGFRLANEKPGLIPDREWKRKQFGTRWYDGETVIAAIGQGYVLVTPLQLAVMTAAVANGGTVLRPRLVQKVVAMDGQVVLQTSTDVIDKVSVPPADLKAVQKGMIEVVNAPHGTGHSSRLAQVLVAGKTGTAQVVKLKEEHSRGGDIPYRFRDHALFVAYAPANKPQIALAVVVEHGTHGGSAAGPIARAILKSYFGLNSTDPKVDQVDAGD